MIRALLVVALIVFLAELGILFSTGMLQFNLEQPGVPPTNNGAAAVAARSEPAPWAEAIPRPTLAPAEPTAAPPPALCRYPARYPAELSAGLPIVIIMQR